MKTSSSVAARFVSPHRTCANRRSSATEANSGSGSGRDHRNKSSSAGLTGNPSSRHSMDVGVACRDAMFQVAADSSVTYHQGGGGSGHRQAPPPDDSIIMCRIKESLKQKEEFLRRPLPGQFPAPPVQPHPAKEFYSRPQKLMPPVWPPPAPPPSSVSPQQQQPTPSEQSCSVAVDPSPEPSSTTSKPKGKQFVNTLSKIHEDCVKSVAVPDAAEHHLKQANLQMVSARARQFESGRTDDKTDFYKSELARLSSKHNVPNVAVRKMEYEQKLTYSDKKQPTVAVVAVAPQPQQAVKDDSITSFSSS